jgi:hypothetical protein
MPRWSKEQLLYELAGWCSNCGFIAFARPVRRDGSALPFFRPIRLDTMMKCVRCGYSWPVYASASRPARSLTNSPEDTTHAHVFISYSRHDVAYVAKLAKHLEAYGLPVWYDASVAPGHPFSEKIAEAIDRCFAFVIVLSPEAVASDWVRRELSRARRKHKQVRPLLRAECEIPLELDGVQFESVVDGRMPGLTFVTELQRLYGRAT